MINTQNQGSQNKVCLFKVAESWSLTNGNLSLSVSFWNLTIKDFKIKIDLVEQLRIGRKMKPAHICQNNIIPAHFTHTLILRFSFKLTIQCRVYNQMLKPLSHFHDLIGDLPSLLLTRTRSMVATRS